MLLIASVITADIVNSSLLSPQRERELIQMIQSILSKHKFEFYRGDSFQAYIKDTPQSLRIALQLRAAAKGFSYMHDIRVSIGIGRVTHPVRYLRTTKNEVFVLSGRGFDKLTGELRLNIISYKEIANRPLRIIAYYADHIFARLTSKQAAVLAELLKGQTQVAIAKKFKKAQATINKHARAASWPEIERLLNEYEETITQFALK